MASGRVGAKGFVSCDLGRNVPAGFLEFIFELHARPQVVSVLEMLGGQVQRLYEWNFLVYCLHQNQVLVNEWRQRTQQPIRNSSQSVEVVRREPTSYAAANLKYVHQLVVDALNLVAEIMATRGKKG